MGVGVGVGAESAGALDSLALRLGAAVRTRGEASGLRHRTEHLVGHLRGSGVESRVRELLLGRDPARLALHRSALQAGYVAV